MKYIKYMLFAIAMATLMVIPIRNSETLSKEYEYYTQLVTCDSAMTDEFYIYMKRLPSEVYDKLLSENWKIIVSDDFTPDGYDDVTLDGLCVNEERIIYINPESVEYTLYHEIGHTYDDDWIRSDSDEFKQLYREECINTDFGIYADHSYAMSASREYFASSFALMLLDPDCAASSQPKTYQYMRRMVYGQ